MTRAADPMPEWRRQANRLRFLDASLEDQFQTERQQQGLTRARGALVLAMLVVAGFGLAEALFTARLHPEFVGESLRLRFFGVVPVWAILVVSTLLPGHLRRADWVYALGMVVGCWMVALIKWHYSLTAPRADLAIGVSFDTLMILFVALAALPMRFHAVLATVLGGMGGVLLFFVLTLLPGKSRDVQLLAVIFTGTGGLLILLHGYREAGERLLFAQQEQMRRMNLELTRLNAEKNEFMAIASHDLRAPLASVRGLAEQLHAGQMEDPVRRSRAHAAIHDLAGRMLGLVNDYLGAHTAESAQLPVTLGRVDLQSFVREAASRNAPVAATKQQVLRVVPGPAVGVRADAALLGQVVDNFVTNALKFSEPGATVELGVAVASDGRVVRLEVTDAGPGIAPGEQAQLFQKFARASTRPTGGESSHGLGLAVAKRLAEVMGGRVGCDSPVNAAGTGARFWIEFSAVVAS